MKASHLFRCCCAPSIALHINSNIGLRNTRVCQSKKPRRYGLHCNQKAWMKTSHGYVQVLCIWAILCKQHKHCANAVSTFFFTKGMATKGSATNSPTYMRSWVFPNVFGSPDTHNATHIRASSCIWPVRRKFLVLFQVLGKAKLLRFQAPRYRKHLNWGQQGSALPLHGDKD